MYVAIDAYYEVEDTAPKVYVGNTKEEAFQEMVKRSKEEWEQDNFGEGHFHNSWPYEMHVYFIGKSGGTVDKIQPTVINYSEVKQINVTKNQRNKVMQALKDGFISNQEADRRLKEIGEPKEFVPEWTWQNKSRW